MNLPNKLTMARIFMVLPFIVFISLSIHYGQPTFEHFNKSALFFVLAGATFVLAMITDALDGHIARSRNLITNFGKLFDPLADKFMTTAAFISLSIMHIVPFWVVIIFVLRDILVDGSRNVAAKNDIKVAASWWGKWKTVMQSVGITLVLFLAPLLNDFNSSLYWSDWKILLLEVPIIIALILSMVSGFKYFSQIKPFIKK